MRVLVEETMDGAQKYRRPTPHRSFVRSLGSISTEIAGLLIFRLLFAPKHLSDVAASQLATLILKRAGSPQC